MGDITTDPRKIEIICGQAGSGKTDAALARYVQCVREHGEDAALLIVPTARVVRQARERLVDDETLGGLVDPRIFTFPQLAQIILNANHECATPIGGAAQRLLIREVIESLIADGELVELAEVSRLPGFSVALMELIADLKRSAVEPARFCRALAEAGIREAWRRELAKLYCAYQWMLICLRYFDEEGVFWWARGVLRDGKRRPLERARLMVVDGFTDFTTTQLEMMQLLAAGLPETLVTLDYVPDDPREGLGEWSADTLARLMSHLPDAQMARLAPAEPDSALAHLRSTLFGSATEVDRRPSAEGHIHLLECPTRSREVREVLARIKRLLTDGSASPGEIAIVCRSVARHADAIRVTADRLGVPVEVEAPTSPAAAPVVKALLHAYETVAGGFDRDAVVSLLRSSYLSFGPMLEGRVTPDLVADSAAEAKVLEGRRQWSERMRALADRRAEREAYRATLEDDAAPERSRLPAEEIERAREAVEGVFELLPDSIGDLTRAERVAETRALMAATGLRNRVATPERAAHASQDIRALDQLEAALDEIEHSRQAPGAGAVPVGEYLEVLREVLDDLADAPPPATGGRVAVLDARRVRQLRFRYCFVIGLNEGEFPRRRRDEPFFTGEHLRALAKAGVDLQRRRSPEGEEPVLLYGAVGAATEGLWLSHAATDAAGKALQPSHYLAEILRCFDEGSVGKRTVALSEVMPAVDDLAGEQELFDRAFADLAESERSSVAYDLLTHLPETHGVIRSAAAGVRVMDRREPYVPPGPYSGLYQDTDIVHEIASAFGDEYRFSGTELGAYAGCPYAFLCARVLRLGEPDAPTADVDARADGNVRHRILRLFINGRIESRPGMPAVDEGEEDEAKREIAELVDREYRLYAAREGVADAALWDIERRRAQEDFARWIDIEAESLSREIPLACEYSFGRSPERPVTLLGRSDIHIEGWVDRVNAAGDGRFSIVDYKRSSAPSWRVVEEAVDPQLPLYTRGVAEDPVEPGRTDCFRWHYGVLRRKVEVRTSKLPPMEVADATAPIVEGYVDGIRAGRFGYLGTMACAEHCAYADVCRLDEWGSRRRSEDADE